MELDPCPLTKCMLLSFTHIDMFCPQGPACKFSVVIITVKGISISYRVSVCLSVCCQSTSIVRQGVEQGVALSYL